jgi:predicted dithiol-disulfide oxidoreductase (DUF899 family)
MTTRTKALPRIVSRKQWQAAHENLLVKEKAATRARDALAATRRRQPMVAIEKEYGFAGPEGKASLLEGARQVCATHAAARPRYGGPIKWRTVATVVTSAGEWRLHQSRRAARI